MALEVQIKKRLNNFVLDVSFTAESGCTAILGASGSGKSMTLKCIAGIEVPDEGLIALNGNVLYDSVRHINLTPQKRRVGYMFQNYALFPNMTVKENLAVALGADGKDRKCRVIADMLRQFNLEELANKYPRHLSGGEQQRVALARILLSEPLLLLLDEPFSAMDSYLREGLQAQLGRTMQDFGGVSLLVSHNRDEVYKLSDTLMVIDAGHSVNFGDTKALFSAPHDLFTARLTGCKNISAAEVISDADSQAVLYAAEWDIRLHMNNELLKKAQALRTVSYIGIRAHDFMVRRPLDEDANKLEISIAEIQEAPFEWNVMFTVKGANPDKTLWWKVSKESIGTQTEIEAVRVLYLKPEYIMLLSRT